MKSNRQKALMIGAVALVAAAGRASALRAGAAAGPADAASGWNYEIRTASACRKGNA